MSETNDTNTGELDLDLGLDTTDGELSTLGDTGSSQSGEHAVADLSFLDGDDNSKENINKEQERQKALEGQIKAAQDKVDAGGDINDVPEYLRKHLQGGSKQTLDEDAIIEKALQRLQNQQQFESMKEQITKMDLTTEQAKNVQVEYDIMINEGLSKTKALATAIRLSGLSSQIQEAEQRGINFGKQSMVPQGLMPAMKKTSNVDPLQLADDDFLKWSNDQASSTSRFTRISN